MKSFTNSIEARLVARPNRFVVLARAPDDRLLRAHCPNPGRLSEILVRNATVILERRTAARTAATDYTLVGAYYQGRVVPMYASRANAVAERLVVPTLFPNVTAVEREVRVGASRIDLRITDDRFVHMVEVKAVTLVEEGIALFPDAPSARAARHVAELAECASPRVRSHVLFCIMQQSATLFAPNVHTDPDFALAVDRFRDSVAYHAAVIATEPDGSARLYRRSVPVSLAPVAFVKADSGCYVLQLEVVSPRSIHVGALGRISFPRGFYLYVGSAQKGLSARIARHMRKTRKTKRWHIDYLRNHTGKPRVVRIYGARNESAIVRDLAREAASTVRGFGASDSPEPSHLLYFGLGTECSMAGSDTTLEPLKRPEIVAILLRHQHVAARSAAG